MEFYKNAWVLNGNKFKKQSFSVENGVFTLTDNENLPFEEKYIIPGLIDIHTHGSFGVDFNDITEEKLEKVCSFFASQGVTTVYPTILTDTEEKTLECIDIIVKAKENGLNAIGGIHLEGPFLSKEYKGAMPMHLLKNPNKELFDKYNKASNGLLKIMTMSAELKDACKLTSYISKQGVVVSLGHSGANQNECDDFFKNGATNVTHLGNAMSKSTQHDLNVLGSALANEEVYAEVICDGYHVNEKVLSFWFKTKKRMVAITDSIMAAGLPDGEYKLGVNSVVVKNSDAKLKGKDTRAGSTLTAINAIKNIAKFTEKDFSKCVKYMTKNPAKTLGLYDKKGKIETGFDADFVVLNHDFDVLETYIFGKCVYKKRTT